MKSVGQWFQQMDLRRRGRLLLIVSGVLGLMVAWMVHTRVSALEEQMGTQVAVLVAREDVQADSPITESMLTTRMVPMRYFLPGMVAAEQKQDIVGRLALVRIAKDQVVSASMFAPSTEADTTARTYTMVSSTTVVFGDLKSGDSVDVLVVYRAENKDRAEILLRSLDVLDAQAQKERMVVTLAVTPAQAEKLAWYENYGKQVRLLKRS